VETRRRAAGLLLGLLAELPRKNCWTIAEHAGDANPDGMQHLLNRASIDTDGLREDLRDYVVEHLGDVDAGGAGAAYTVDAELRRRRPGLSVLPISALRAAVVRAR